MKKARMVCCTSMCAMIYLICYNIISSYIEVLWDDPIQIFDENSNETKLTIKLIYNMYFPFDISLDGYFYVAFFYEIYAIVILMVIFSAVNWPVISTLLLLINQVRVIKRVLSFVDVHEIDDAFSKRMQKRMRIGKCAQEIKSVIGAVLKIEDMYNEVMALQYGLSMFLLCCFSCVIERMTLGPDFFTFLTIVVVVVFEMLTFCWMSQTLTEELVSLNPVLYSLNWTEYGVSMKKDLVFLMARMNKPVILTAGKMQTLHLDYFIFLLKTTYSMYTLVSSTGK